MTSFELQAFVSLIQANSMEEATACCLKTPVLLSDGLWPEFAAWSKNQSEEVQARSCLALKVLAELFRVYKEQWYDYPFGPGPLDSILHRLIQGEIDEEQSALMAGAPEVVRNLSVVYVRARLMQFAEQALRADWRMPLVGHRQILTALDARQAIFTRDQKAMEFIAAKEYANVAKQCVWETADGRVQKGAVARLKAVLSFNSETWGSTGAAEYALGQLFLDPYIYKRSSVSFQQQIDNWMRLPFEKLGAAVTKEMAEEIKLPTPQDAFTEASQHFLASANLLTGPERGLSLKGHIEAEVWKKIAGGSMAELSKAAAEANQLLANARYEGVRAEIDSLMRVGGQQTKAAEWRQKARELAAADTAQAVARNGLTPTTEFLLQVAQAVLPEDPELALTLWSKALPYMLRRDETSLGAFLQAGAGYVDAALADPGVRGWQLAGRPAARPAGPTPAAGRTPLEAGQQVLQLAKSDHWTQGRVVGSLLSLAMRSQASNNELQGIQLTRTAKSINSDLNKQWGPVFAWLTAYLYRGEASNQFEANDYEKAMQAYALSAFSFLEAGLPGEAMDAVEHGVNLVNRQPVLANKFAIFFGGEVAELERQGGNAVIARLRDLGRWMFPLVSKGEQAVAETLELLGILKGVLMTAAWQAGGKLEWIDSQESKELLRRIEEVRQQAGGAAVHNIGGLTLDELVTVYAEETETAAGDSPASTLHNLEVGYDQALRRKMSARRAGPVEWKPALTRITQALSDETVLIDYYLGNLPNGNAGLYLHILTQKTATLGLMDFGIPGVQVMLGKHGFPADVVSLSVENLRSGIQQDPKGAEVTDEARQALNVSAYMNEPTEQVLRKFRQEGKWHLCVVPNGPLHFLPFHLLPYNGGLLGDEWAVTYLPAMGMLESRAAGGPTRAKKMASFGIEFKNGTPHGLEEIKGAEDEARAVAAVFGEEALTGATATESALKDALVNAERIHISTHGALTVSAPSFQRVYLSPDEKSDGILHAWELLRLDLSGLDLLTLSACQTSLGRVDKGDNLRSLSGNALIAGANTVIGTLWPVRNGVPQVFFEAFYKEIGSGAGKREGFQTAQLTTREKFPAYLDWGSFSYAGNW